MEQLMANMWVISMVYLKVKSMDIYLVRLMDEPMGFDLGIEMEFLREG
jgi:hypothetical protein